MATIYNFSGQDLSFSIGTNCEIATCLIVSYFTNSLIDFGGLSHTAACFFALEDYKYFLLEKPSKPIWISLTDGTCEQVLFILEHLQSLLV